MRAKERVYILLYKPTGYITTFSDPDGRPTVYDLIPDVDTFVSPVGRLDLDTSGLLILTNDTQFAERLTNPEHKMAKTYLVKCAGILSDEALERLRRGVELSDGPTLPARVRRVRDTGRNSHIEIAITEGRNRQVRRMVEAVGQQGAEAGADRDRTGGDRGSEDRLLAQTARPKNCSVPLLDFQAVSTPAVRHIKLIPRQRFPIRNKHQRLPIRRELRKRSEPMEIRHLLQPGAIRC